jgi:hypothetical protein
MKTPADYSIAYDIGVDALDRCAKETNASKDALAGLMTVVINAAYAAAPTEEAAEEIITWAQKTALESWEDEKANR